MFKMFWWHISTQNILLPTTGAELMQALSVFTMGALWGLNALSVWGNQGCIQIKMTDRDIKAQWHFTNLWYCGRLLCIQGFKLKPLGNVTISESSQVSAERRLTVGETAYRATFYLAMVWCYHILTYRVIRVIRTVSDKNRWAVSAILCYSYLGRCTSLKVNTRETLFEKKSIIAVDIFCLQQSNQVHSVYTVTEWVHKQLAWSQGLLVE